MGIRSLSRARGGAFMAGGGHGVGPDGGKGGGGSNRGMVAGAPSGTDAYSRQAAGGAASAVAITLGGTNDAAVACRMLAVAASSADGSGTALC